MAATVTISAMPSARKKICAHIDYIYFVHINNMMIYNNG